MAKTEFIGNSKRFSLKTTRQGQILIISIIFFLITILLTSIFLSRTSNFIGFFGRSIAGESARQLAEAGMDHAIGQINNPAFNPPSYPYEATLNFGQGVIQYKIESTGLQRKITSSGFIQNSTNPRAKRTVKASTTFSNSVGPGFQYAVQTDGGIFGIGVNMATNSQIVGAFSGQVGNVYTNGSICCASSSGAAITGSAYAVGTISAPYPTIGNPPAHPGSPSLPLPDIDPNPFIAGATQETICSPTCTISSSTTIGAKKYTGNLTISGGTVTITGPIYVTGSFTMSGNAQMRISDSMTEGTAMVVGGVVTLDQNTSISPSYISYPYKDLMILKTGNDPGFFTYGVVINSTNAKAVFYAKNATVNIGSAGTGVRQVTAFGIVLYNNAVLAYENGLASETFTSGTGGSWKIKKGSYQFTATP